MRAFHNVDYIIHAAALKQVPAAEYNPFDDDFEYNSDTNPCRLSCEEMRGYLETL